MQVIGNSRKIIGQNRLAERTKHRYLKRILSKSQGKEVELLRNLGEIGTTFQKSSTSPLFFGEDTLKPISENCLSFFHLFGLSINVEQAVHQNLND